MRNRNRRSGFTLIEVVVTVIVIAILAVIGGVSYGKWKGAEEDKLLQVQADFAFKIREIAEEKNPEITPAEIEAKISATLDLGGLDVTVGDTTVTVTSPTTGRTATAGVSL